MTFVDILHYDSIHNQNEHIDLDNMVDEYHNMVSEGFNPYREGNTVFMMQPQDDVAFYHTANADNRTQYVANMDKFFTLLRLKGFKAAYTTLENPKLKSFVTRYFKNTVVVEDKAITYLDIKETCNGLG